MGIFFSTLGSVPLIVNVVDMQMNFYTASLFFPMCDPYDQAPITILINFKQMYILWQSSGMCLCYFFLKLGRVTKSVMIVYLMMVLVFPISTDRDKIGTGKSQGGWVFLYMNEWWCDRSSLTVRKRQCTADIELLSVSLRPTYLPRDFGCAISFYCWSRATLC